MKFPMLSSPVVTRITDGDSEVTITTEITVASQFDLLPTWVQYIMVVPLVLATIALLVMA